MKKLISKISALFCLILLWQSCGKLEEKPTGILIPEDFYATKGQIEATFAASLDILWQSWGGYAYNRNTFYHDDQLNGGNLILPINQGTDLWNRHYKSILYLNNAIGAMKEGRLTSASDLDITELTGQAKFLRAFNYFMLVRFFGDIPLLTEDIADPTTAEIRRTPVKEVYDLIVADFTEAIQKLPVSWPANQRGRPTKDAAKGLLAKAHLTMATAPLNARENYAEAARLAREIIEDGRYELIADINKVFSIETKFGPEVLWSFISNYEDLATDPRVWAPIMIRGWGDHGVNPRWEREYPDQPRKDAYLLIELDGVHYTDWSRGNIPGIKKFLYGDPADYESFRSVINFPVIRYADVLLIYAEAENMANGAPTAAAVDAINQVIQRANAYQPNPAHPLLTTALSADEFDELVIEERNYELCFEYDRWFDLIRKRILGEKNPEWIHNFSEDDYLFPIPQRDLETNKLLTQNPGYPTP